MGRLYTCLLLSVVFSNTGVSQKLTGLIKDDKGIPLPFATIQIKNTDKGVVSNVDGFYELILEPGTYSIRYQFVGYRTKDTTIILGNSPIVANITLRAESLTLPTAVITGDNEDPAYTIMRRTIAKAPYHANQIDQYNARVYLKGSGRILKIPFLFRNRLKKEMAKEGIDSTVAFTQESVSKLSYKRPGQYRDTVISIKATGDDNNTSPMSFVASSFYDAKVATAVSPLAPNAFSIYNFEYLGYFEEHGNVINKIKVTPKSRGDQVFEGTIYITDQLWNIHSLNLTTYIWGIEFAIKQVYAPVKDDIWMPVDQIFDVGGNVFGFGFEYKYLAHLSNYQVVPNPEISIPILVLDDKKEATESKLANEKINTAKLPSFSALEDNQELSAKKLRKMMKEYKKKELDSIPEVEKIDFTNVNESKQYIDTQALKQDSLSVETLRPIALTDYEIKGYSRFDSLAKVQKEKEIKKKEDSTVLNINLGSDGTTMQLVKSKKAFKLQDIIFGGKFTINEKKNFITIVPMINLVNFNAVEGLYAGYKLQLGNYLQKGKNLKWNISPEIGYSFAREKINYQLDYELYNVRKSGTKNFTGWNLKFIGGSKPFGFSHALNRGSYLNALSSIFYKRNYLKLYQKEFLATSFAIETSSALKFNFGLAYEERSPLINNTNWSLAKRKESYDSNFPNNKNINSLAISAHNAIITQASVTWTPFYTYLVANGQKTKDRSGSPIFMVQYKGGWNDTRFDHIQLNIRKHISIGAGDDWDWEINTGSFINKPQFFQDYSHFNGNEFIYSPNDPIKFFRALPYYAYSTNGSHLTVMNNYQFRKFIATSIPFIRKKGIRENIIINSLFTQDHTNYSEIGYGINYILRFLRLEAVSTWRDYKYQNLELRFGFATGFDQLFKF